MECKKCGKSISEFELYCDDCKELLKQEKELDKLIIENKELNKLEITKEVETLQNFKDEQKETSSSLKEELKDLVNIEEIESSLKEKDNKKIVIIIFSIIILMILVASITLLVKFNKQETEEIIEPEKINYKEILNDYGKEITLIISNYLDINKDLPTWSTINDLIKFDRHEIICGVHSVYEDGSIYLDKCVIDNKNIEYSYGIKKEEKKEGKKIEVYKKVDDKYYSYTINNEGLLELVGEINCKTDSCEYINAYDKFVLIKENSQYYLYNYENGNIEFGPFNMIDEQSVLAYQNKLYGVLYDDNNKMNIYNVNTEKKLKDLSGELLLSMNDFNPEIMHRYGYVILKDNDKNNFINLKSGNISYTINGLINSFIEDNINNIVYITTINSLNSKITIYNSNGKTLFDGKEYKDIEIYNGKLIVSTDKNFYVYNSKLNLEISSEDYNILDLHNQFVFAIDNENLKILDLNDTEITTFDFKLDNKKYKFDANLSTDTELKFIINNEETNGFLECYYNILTKETKITEVAN